MTRTTRIQGEYASQGAVRQAGGRLELYRCNACQANVAWATSKRTGRKYLVNVSHSHGGQAFYIGSNIHTDDQCAKRVADNDAYIRRLTVEAIAARMCDLTFAARDALAAGLITDEQCRNLCIMIVTARRDLEAQVA